MKKKKSSGGGANWMDTYGDMVTLLLCFFVLLYSMSTISEEAWKNLVMSFNPNAVAEGEVPDSTSAGPSSDGEDAGVMPQDQQEIDQEIEELYLALQEMTVSQGVTESVSVSKDGGRIFVTFSGTTFFKADSYALTAEALPVLDSIGEMLTNVAYSIDEVRISGHTAQYSAERPNNVEEDRFLASNRATKVLVYIQTHTNSQVLDPAKLVSEGWGQWHPIGKNDTEEEKRLNRRVEMVISGRNLEQELAENGGVESYYTEGQTPPAGSLPTANPENSTEPASSTGPENSAGPESSASPSSSAAVQS